ncbi:MAG TPA: cation:proton antiporter [Candidatus Hypogeohydataceae bacterium YC38]|nr:cation:proton antiporter [Candidatus Brocadiales bacterium]
MATDSLNVLLAIAIILLAAKAGETVAKKLGDPGLTGELIMGILLGNFWLIGGWRFFDFLREMQLLNLFEAFGAIVLLVKVGLHTDLRALVKVGVSSFLVATGGVFAPLVLGFLVGQILLPEAPVATKLFLAVSLCATSMAVKLRVLDELKMLETTEGRIIIGAAMADDVITLTLLGIVSGMAVGGEVSYAGLGIILIVSLLFFIAVGAVGLRYNLVFGDFVTRRLAESLKIPVVVTVSLGLALLAESVGLNTALGAFLAGLLLQNVRLKDFEYKEHGVEWFVGVAGWILIPIFFVKVGAEVHIESFFDLKIVLVGLGITVAAILGKLFCSVCVVEKGVNRLAIGVAMIPRLEVGLITATVGKNMGVLSDALYSSIVVMVVLTSLSTPSLFKASLLRRKSLTI